jgi:hypothetical protein
MKKLNKIAPMLIGISGLALIYNYFMIQPELVQMDNPGLNFDYMYYDSYRDQSDWFGGFGTVLGGAGAIMGFISFFKSKDKMGIVGGLAGIAIALATFLVSFGRVI